MIGKLYLKIFLSFVLILVVIEVLIFALFIFSGRTGFRAMFAQYASAQSMIIKELIEEKINADPEIQIDKNEEVRRIILRLGESYKAQVWQSVQPTHSGNCPQRSCPCFSNHSIFYIC